MIIRSDASGPLWSGLSSGAYCSYNDDQNKGNTYGHLYNWYAVSDSRNIAPVGWHVPTNAEWLILINYLGASEAASKLKESGTSHWTSPNEGANNISGFTALPGGHRGIDGTYASIESYGNWWASDQSDITNANDFYMCYAYHDGRSNINDKRFGFSVRCVKDE